MKGTTDVLKIKIQKHKYDITVAINDDICMAGWKVTLSAKKNTRLNG